MGKTTHSEMVAFLALGSAYGAGFTSARYVTSLSSEKVDEGAMGDQLGEQALAVATGDMLPVESTLLAQALTLDAVFHDIARRAADYRDAGHLEHFDKLLRLALKAQAQSRATLEALVEAKTPRSVAFVRQANVNAGSGQMQVNNGSGATPAPAAHAGARARGTAVPREESGTAPNGLLEDAVHEQVEWVDTGAARTAGRTDPAVETLGAGHRPAHR